MIDEQDTHQRLVQHPLRSKKPIGLIQELYGLLIAHYAIHAMMAQAAAQVPLDPRRLSFVSTVQLITDAIPDFQKVRPTQRLLTDILQHLLPPVPTARTSASSSALAPHTRPNAMPRHSRP